MGRKTAILIRRGKDSNLSKTNLLEGELAFTTDKKELFIGSSTGNIKIVNNNISGFMENRIYDPDRSGKVLKAKVADESKFAERAGSARNAEMLGEISKDEVVTKSAITWNQLKGAW